MPVHDDMVYLDFAATAAVRPASVAAAMLRYLDDVGATAGRGGHRLAIEAGRTALRCRQALVQLLDLPGDTGRVTFAANATHALNTALHGTLRRGDRVVVTAFDHNSVLRPCAALSRDRGVDTVMVQGSADGTLDMDALRRALDGARLVVINAASNVLGTLLDVKDIAALARDADVLTLVDTAQLAGHVPFSARAVGVDMVAFTGHKGLLGPQGTGGLWVREGIDVDPLISGGTGGDSMARTMPVAWPDHLEAGTLNGPGIAGLGAGINALLAEGVDTIHARLRILKGRLRESLADCGRVSVLSPAAPDGVPIVTITAQGMDPATLAARLDRDHGVLTRAGLHCAPEVHRMLGTQDTGALRFSLGWSSTEQDVDAAAAAVEAVLA